MKHTIIAIGDTHLRDSQYGSSARGEDFATSLYNIIDKAIYRKNNGEPISGILHAGDLLDTTRPSPATLRALISMHAKLIRARLSMFVISGNHDKTTPHWADVLEPDENGYGIVCADHQLKVINGVRVYCIPYCVKEALLEEINTIMPDNVDIVMWHGAVQEFIGYPSDTALSLDELPVGKFKNILIGDTHVTKVDYRQSFTAISPGSTEVCRNVEPLQKSQIEFTYDAGDCRVEVVPIDTRKYLVYRLVSDIDVQNALDDVKQHLDSKPVILIQAHPSLLNVKSRFGIAIDTSKCLLRIGTMAVSSAGAPRAAADIVKVDPKSMLAKYVPSGTKLYELAMRMVDPDTDEKAALEAYCDEHLK